MQFLVFALQFNKFNTALQNISLFFVFSPISFHKSREKPGEDSPSFKKNRKGPADSYFLFVYGICILRKRPRAGAKLPPHKKNSREDPQQAA